jgi:hypothetical protein
LKLFFKRKNIYIFVEVNMLNQFLKIMRTIKFLSLMLIAVAFLASCNKEYAEPVVTWAGGNNQVIDFSTGNNTIERTVEIEAEGTIKDFEIWKIPYIGDEPAQGLSELMDTGEEWKGLLSFVYDFSQTVAESEFSGGITKIEFEFIVTDEQLQETTEVFTVTRVEAYTVTFTVKDGMDNDIEDAVITFNEVENEAGEYTFTYVVPGTFDYTVTKAGYIQAEGQIEVAENVTQDVVLYQNLTDYSDQMILRHSSQDQQEANYYGVDATHIMNVHEIGAGYPTANYTNVEMLRIVKTDGCDGWVLVDDISTITHYHDLYDIYTEDGVEIIDELEITVREEGTWEKSDFNPIYFVSKVGNNYVLVKIEDALRHAQNGHVVVFKHKTKVNAE